jgi:hypothetical protein
MPVMGVADGALLYATLQVLTVSTLWAILDVDIDNIRRSV